MQTMKRLMPLMLNLLKLLFSYLCTVNRKRWSEYEEQELRRYFSDYFNGKPGKTCPTRSECIQAVKCSEDNQGNIWKRGWETIKKKVNNMLMKNQKK